MVCRVSISVVVEPVKLQGGTCRVELRTQLERLRVQGAAGVVELLVMVMRGPNFRGGCG